MWRGSTRCIGISRRGVPRGTSWLEGLHPIDPLGYEHFVHLTGQAHLVLSDSEGIEEESHVFGKPTLIM